MRACSQLHYKVLGQELQYLRYIGTPSRVAYYSRDAGREIGLRRGQYISDLLDDTRTQKGNLSVYEVDDEITAEMIVAAIAAKSGTATAKGFLILDDAIFEEMRIGLTQTKGDSYSYRANEERHYDAFLGGVEKRISLSRKLMKQVTPGFITKPEMKQNINAFRMSGFINRVNEKLDIELKK